MDDIGVSKENHRIATGMIIQEMDDLDGFTIYVQCHFLRISNGWNGLNRVNLRDHLE